MPQRTLSYACSTSTHTITIYECNGSQPGPTLLVTAGIDGDEYAGCEAAKELAEIYEKKNFIGTLRIVPIVNEAGYEAQVSWNPHDKRYPKHIFPGLRWGSCSSRLMWHLWNQVGKHANVWIDLHSGGIQEQLYPFVWFFQTPHKRHDALLKKLLLAMPGTLGVYERVGLFSKQAKLARSDCLYFMVEAGERGRINDNAIEFHQQAIQASMTELGMIPGQIRLTEKKLFRYVEEYHSPADGLWKPKSNIPQLLDISHHLGTLVRTEHATNFKIDSKGSAMYLWCRIQSYCKKGDLLVALGKHEHSGAFLVRRAR